MAKKREFPEVRNFRARFEAIGEAIHSSKVVLDGIDGFLAADAPGRVREMIDEARRKLAVAMAAMGED